MKRIVQQPLKIKDGSKIYYVTSPTGVVHRVIDYAATDSNPAEHVDNAGKYHYLKTLANVKDDIGPAIFNEIQYMYNKTSDKFDLELCREICDRIRKRCFFEQAEVFFCAIYLEMLDYEATKQSIGRLGKKMVLEGCKAVLLENVPYAKAATLYTTDI